MATKTNPMTKDLPPKRQTDRHPHAHDAPEGEGPKGLVTKNGICQTWDDDLTQRLKELGDRYGKDDYDPVVAMAEMALDPTLEDRIRFNCHKEVAKYVRLKRQLEPTINIQQNVYHLPPAQRRERIETLTKMLDESRKVIEHDPTG